MSQEVVVIDGNLSLSISIDGELALDIKQDGEVGTITRIVDYNAPDYEGITEVYPDFNEIILETKNKTVKSNITINPIRVENTSNESGGRTVYIGGIA